jgi:hypothetical protein
MLYAGHFTTDKQWAPLSSMRQGPLIQVSSIGLTHPSTLRVLADEVMLQMLPHYQGTLLPWSTCPNAFLMHVIHIINRCFNWGRTPAAILTDAQGTVLWRSVPNIYVYHLLYCLDCIKQETVLELCWCHHISFPSVPSFHKRNGAKSGEYRQCRTAMSFYRVLRMAWHSNSHNFWTFSTVHIETWCT